MNYELLSGEQFILDALNSDQEWQEIVKSMDDSFGVIILNQHAIPMTLNWLCNTANMPNVHARTLFFTIDSNSYNILSDYYPNLKIFQWMTPCLKVCK